MGRQKNVLETREKSVTKVHVLLKEIKARRDGTWKTGRRDNKEWIALKKVMDGTKQ